VAHSEGEVMKPVILLILEWSDTVTGDQGIQTVRYNKSSPANARRAAQKLIADYNALPNILVDAARLERLKDNVVNDDVVLCRWIDGNHWSY
jgi:hypothetical protein